VPARAALLAIVLLALVEGGSTAAGRLPPAELSYALRLRGSYTNTAICVTQGNEFRRARRMTGLGEFTTGAWSRDGLRFAVGGGKRTERRIRVVNADGRGWSAATTPRPTERDSAPTWAPDGQRIAFSRYVYFGPGTDYGRAGVWVVDVGTKEERQISRTFAGSLAWSPTGDLIAAEAGGEFNIELLLLREDGRGERKIHARDLAVFEDGVSWSPDGARLALGGGIIVDRSGREVGRYAAQPTNYVVRSPSWSPDGTTIAYERALRWTAARTNVPVLGSADLYMAPAVGGSPSRLTETVGISEGHPVWRRPAGTRGGTSQPCILLGTSGRNVIRGTALDDLVDAGRGNDLVYGRGGNDLLVGGPGADALNGGAGSDELLGEAGNDRVHARDRTFDAITGGWGRDLAWVDRRRDRVEGVELVFPR
jgi:hypothetical protein